jgi:hypothetical protein
VAYLTASKWSIGQAIYIALNGRLIVNNELESTWKEAVVAKFEVSSRHVHGGTEETHEFLVHDSHVQAQIRTGISQIRIRNVTA